MILLASIAACTRRAKAPWGWKRGTLSGETMPREGSPSSWKDKRDEPRDGEKLTQALSSVGKTKLSSGSERANRRLFPKQMARSRM